MPQVFSAYLGLVPYAQAFALQQRLAQARKEGSIPDVLLLLQHSPVFTLGRFRGEKEILVPAAVLQKEGIDVCRTNRGGSITYHGPGQLVGYPIFNLKGYGMGVREYIWRLEDVIIRVLADTGIQAQRRPELPGGIWVGPAKICSIGIAVSRYVTMHGFALNVDTGLGHFELINPCGLKGAAMTSVAKVLGREIGVERLVRPVLDAFAAVFGVKYEQGNQKCRDILDGLNG